MSGGIKLLLVILSILIIASLMVVKVYQASTCRLLISEISSCSKKINQLISLINLRTSRLEGSLTPEYLVWLSSTLGSSLKKIAPENNYYIQEESYGNTEGFI